MTDQNSTYAIGIDVGGTTVDAGLVVQDGSDHSLNISGNVARIDSPSEKPFEEMIKQLGDLIIQVKHEASESGNEVSVIGIAMPGPFDYVNGISKMPQKFLDAYEKDFKTPLQHLAQAPIFFVNDADAFGLGVYSKLYPTEDRILAITLGTGVGSAFVVKGQLATLLDSEQNNIPKDGEIYNLPFKQGQLEDYVSRLAIEKAYENNMGYKLQVKELAELARKLDPQAIEIFTKFGEDLGKGLSIICEKFKPNRIVIGGQIAKSLDLFEKEVMAILNEQINENSISISAAVDENYAIYGAAYYAKEQLIKG